MRTLLISALLIVLPFVSGSAQAAPTWPAKCGTMKCVNKHLNALHKAQVRERKFLRDELDYLYECVAFEVLPVDLREGYVRDGASSTGFDLFGQDQGDIIPFALFLGANPDCFEDAIVRRGPRSVVFKR